MLGRVKRVVQEALANADVPFQQVVNDANLPRSTAYTSIFQAMFTFNRVNSAEADDAEPDPVEVCGLRCVSDACVPAATSILKMASSRLSCRFWPAREIALTLGRRMRAALHSLI